MSAIKLKHSGGNSVSLAPPTSNPSSDITFKLPQADKEMPSFMKVAAKGIEEQNTANLEDAEIMRIMGTYGVGPEEARRIYDEMIYGYERDEAAISPTDWRSILKMIESGMSQEEIDAQLAAAQFPGNFTDNPQNVKTLPTNLKTAPDHPETSLAYITDDEKALLAFMKPGTPHKGPEGVPTYDEGDYLPYGGIITTGIGDKNIGQIDPIKIDPINGQVIKGEIIKSI